MNRLIVALFLGFTSFCLAQVDLSTPGGQSILVTFASTPSGAEVYVSDTYIGTSTAQVRINANTATTYRFHMPDGSYPDYSGIVNSATNEVINIALAAVSEGSSNTVNLQNEAVTEPEVNTNPKINHIENVDLFTDEDTSFVAVLSESSVNEAKLLWRCNGNTSKFDVVLLTDEYLGSGPFIDYRHRFDKEDTRDFIGLPNTEGTGVFVNTLSANEDEGLNKLNVTFTINAIEAQTLAFGVTDYKGTEHQYQFSLDGLEYELRKLKCIDLEAFRRQDGIKGFGLVINSLDQAVPLIEPYCGVPTDGEFIDYPTKDFHCGEALELQVFIGGADSPTGPRGIVLASGNANDYGLYIQIRNGLSAYLMPETE